MEDLQQPVFAPVVEKNTPQTFCTYQTCASGHEWVPRIAVAACPGCAAPTLCVEMRNCPTCNEPANAIRLRSEHLLTAQALTAACKGQPAPFERGVLDIRRDWFKDVERDWTVPIPQPRTGKEKE